MNVYVLEPVAVPDRQEVDNTIFKQDITEAVTTEFHRDFLVSVFLAN